MPSGRSRNKRSVRVSFTSRATCLLTSTTNLKSYEAVKRFLLKRVARIYPPYALALLAFWCLSIISGWQLLSGLALGNLYTGDYLITLWFISMIITFYCLFAIVNYKYSTRRCVWIASVLCFLLMVEKLCWRRLDPALITYWPPFVLGILHGKNAGVVFDVSAQRLFLMAGLFVGMLFLSTNDLLPSRMGILFVSVMVFCFVVSGDARSR